MNSKHIVVAVLLAAVVAAGVAAVTVYVSKKVPGQQDPSAGSIRTTPDTYPYGVILRDVKEFGKLYFELDDGANFGYITNKTGKTVYVQDVFAELFGGVSSSSPGVASSSFRFFVGISTTTTLNPLINPETGLTRAGGALASTSLMAWQIATSTRIGTTTSLLAIQSQRVDAGFAILAPDQSLIFGLVAGLTGIPSGDCFSATSTNSATWPRDANPRRQQGEDLT